MVQSPSALQERIGTVRARIARVCERAERDPAGVRLVAVTKEVPIEVVRWALEAGCSDFGENYVKEMAEKVPAHPEATWHYVGALQGSTAHRVADLANVVHSLVPGRPGTRLAGRAHRSGKHLAALVQVDFTGAHAGIAPDEAPAFAREAARLEGLDLRGLMTLPPAPERPEDSRRFFRQLRKLRDGIRQEVDGFHELSMGMSADYEVAVEEGATMVRVGTALFGARRPFD